MPVIRPEPRHARPDRPRAAAAERGRVVPAGEDRTIFALPWLGQTLVGTTDNDYEGSLEHPPVSESDVDVPAGRGQLVLRDRLRARRPGRRLRGRAAADLQRRPEEERRHLAQGRAVRDLVRADHDHRRQAHDLAPHGEDGRRPHGGAGVPRGAVPHPRDPARSSRSTRRCCTTRRDRRASPARTGRPLRPVRRAGARDLRGGPGPAPADRRGHAGPARGGGRRGPLRAGAQRSPTCCCGARAWACSPAGARSRTPTPRCASRRRWRRSSAGAGGRSSAPPRRGPRPPRRSGWSSARRLASGPQLTRTGSSAGTTGRRCPGSANRSLSGVVHDGRPAPPSHTCDAAELRGSRACSP